ncbi:MAG: hypothetical protein MJ233_03085 [Mycoplasmoidaceae bacterium]|nr:hypothetical protein [Mycoplasmoidaceae bacterium]
MYLGLSLQALIISELKAKELLSLSEYCQKENIKVGILRKVYNPKIDKYFKNTKIFIIDELDQLTKLFAVKN